MALESAGIYLLMYLSCLVSIQFSRGYLYTRRDFPRLDRFLRGLLLACVVLLASEPLVGLRAWNVLASLTVMLVSLSLLLAGVHVWRQGLRYGLYYILACALLLSFLVTTAASLGFELFGLFGSSVVKIGMTVELVTLSIGSPTASMRSGGRLPLAPGGRAGAGGERGEEPLPGEDEP